MSDLKCKYCGRKFLSGASCYDSPTKRHIALANGKNCVYCGQTFLSGASCYNSPSKKHQLDT